MLLPVFYKTKLFVAIVITTNTTLYEGRSMVRARLSWVVIVKLVDAASSRECVSQTVVGNDRDCSLLRMMLLQQVLL